VVAIIILFSQKYGFCMKGGERTTTKENKSKKNKKVKNESDNEMGETPPCFIGKIWNFCHIFSFLN
jgi:hypothetical protein